MIARRTALAALALFAGSGRRLGAQPAATLRVGSVVSDGFGEVWYAQDMGFFNAAGLNVEITAFPNGSASAQAVVGGALDIGITGPIGLANATIHGVPLVYVAVGNIYNTAAPTIAFCVAKESPLRTAKDFEGATIAVQGIKDPTHLAAITWFVKNGADVAKISVVEVPVAQMGGALERGTVAGAMLSEPFLTAATTTSARIFAKAYDAIANRVMLAGWFARADWVSRNTPLARRFAAAIHQTAVWANANHERSGAILQKYSKISDETLRAMTRVTYGERLDPALIEPQLQIAARLKFTERLVTANEVIARL
jgi:NitT/TauT family transport system substrate-binding protein